MRTRTIRDFIISNVEDNPKGVTRLAAERFGISTKAVNYHLRKLASEGVLEATGATRAREYRLAVESHRVEVSLLDKLEEDRVWEEVAAPFLDAGNPPPNVREICHYGFTEIVNNAIDHSEGSTVLLLFERSAGYIRMVVDDDGVGIFRKITRDLGLSDERQALLELSKGKITTDPSRHSGQGIFFTTRAFDKVTILSSKLFFLHGTGERDWLIDDGEESVGTLVSMEISMASERKLSAVFDAFSTPESDFAFDRTSVPVRLARFGEEALVSRSQAKRLLAGIDRFKEVWLDFQGVSSIGQAFADEIFRVYTRSHPEITILPVNADEEILRMILRTKSGTDLSEIRERLLSDLSE